MGCVAGIDLGGTKIYTVLLDAQGKILAEMKTKTEAHLGAASILERMAQGVAAVCADAGVALADLAGVGVAAPGPLLDLAQGKVVYSNNLHWHDVPVIQAIEAKLHLPAYLENDANAAALGESILGAGVEEEEMVYLTVSTGIGGGIIIHKQIYHGAFDGAGEFGHMTLLPQGPQCTCGNRGCFEALASGTAIARQARELIAVGQGKAIWAAAGGKPEQVNACLVAQVAEAGDLEAREIWQGVGRFLGIGIANIVTILNPPLVVLGGGVMQSRQLFWSVMEEEMKDRLKNTARNGPRLVLASLGEKAGAIGAGVMVLSKKNGQKL